MSDSYGSIITTAGAALEAAAIASGIPVNLTQFVVGDGNGQAVTPSPEQVELVNEVYRGEISNIKVSTENNSQIIAQLIIPSDSGGYVVREFGLLTEDGTLYSVSGYPDFTKPLPESRSAISLQVSYALTVESSENVTVIFTGEDYLTEERANTLYLKIGAYGLGVGAQHKDDAFNNKGEFYRINASSANTPGNNAYGGISAPIDGSPATAYFFGGGDHSGWLGLSTTAEPGVVKWARLFTTEFPPTPGDINAVEKTGDTMTGQLITPSVATTPEATPWGAGPFSEQLNSQASFFQPNWQWPVTSGGIYVPIAKGVVTRQGEGYPTAVSFGYLLNGTPGFAIPCIHAKGDNVDVHWRFDPNTGQLYSPGNILAGGAIFHTDGNITGDIWGGYLSDWLNTNIANAQNNAQNWAYQNLQQDSRLVGRNAFTADGTYQFPSGGVLTALGDFGADNGYGEWSQSQKLINGVWINIGGN